MPEYLGYQQVQVTGAGAGVDDAGAQGGLAADGGAGAERPPGVLHRAG